MALNLKVTVDIKQSLDLIEATDAQLSPLIKEAFAREVLGLLDHLGPDGFVISDRSPELGNGIDDVAAGAGDFCLGVLEIPGLTELCAAALRAPDFNLTDSND